MKGSDGKIYDIDFFMVPQPGKLTVTQTSVHKINGKPLYNWKQQGGVWKKCPFHKAHLGVPPSSDMFGANSAHSYQPGASPQDAGGVTTSAESAIHSCNDKTREA